MFAVAFGKFSRVARVQTQEHEYGTAEARSPNMQHKAPIKPLRKNVLPIWARSSARSLARRWRSGPELLGANLT